MSNYSKITKHPQTGFYEMAQYRDDYFGPHIYGIYFESDDKTYPADIVESCQIYDFWKEDVIRAYCEIHNCLQTDQCIVEFLNHIQQEYLDRWERDPVTGEGATEKSRVGS